ncbi:hypothetical protein LXA43DRAFT_1066055 [Ganoderma leucocontextum]|nr:hypothetical protein LXA43DRAFT_1066055 [Ganoderma leucocontextum]
MMFVCPKLGSLSLALRMNDNGHGHGRLLQVLDFATLWWVGSRPIHSLAATVDMTNLPPPSEDPEDDEYDDYSPFDGGFGTLKHLTVRGLPEHLDLFLDATVTRDLESHTVEFTKNASEAVITRCIDTILEDTMLGPPVLRELTIKYPYESPALHIPFLRKVMLDFHRLPALTDAGLQTIDAWPKLTALHITLTRERYPSNVKLTPSVLVSFPRECPRLAELTLPEVLLDDVPAEKEMQFVGQRALRLLRLSFRDRGRQDVLYKAALFVDRLFPCLALNPSFQQEEDAPGNSLIRMLWENNARDEERTWRRIEEFLYAMQLGRRHREELKNASH